MYRCLLHRNMPRSPPSRHARAAAAVALLLALLGRSRGDGAAGDDVTVFVNADLLGEGGRGMDGGLAATEKLGVAVWEECASACSEHTCCTGFVFVDAAATFGSCRIIEGAQLDPPSPQHLREGAVSGILRGPAPAECSTMPNRAPGGRDASTTLVAALLPDLSSAGRAEWSIPDDTYWGIVAIMELRMPLVLVTHSALLPSLAPLLHEHVRVMLVRLTNGVLEGDPEAGGSRHGVPVASQASLDMLPHTEEVLRIHRELFEAGRGECAPRRPLEVGAWQVGVNKLIWLSWVAQHNPFEGGFFLWMDIERCAHLLAGPLDLSFLRGIEDRVATYASAAGQRPACVGTLPIATLHQHHNESFLLVHSEIFGGSARALAQASVQYLETFRWVLDQGHVVFGEQLLTLVHLHEPSLLHTIASDDNIQHIDMAESTCWSTRILSVNAPRFEVAWPPQHGVIAAEEAVVVLSTEKLLRSNEGKFAMYNEHRYSLASGDHGSEVTAQVQICAHVTEGQSQGSCSLPRHGFREATGEASCSVSFRCSESEPLWLGELGNGEYTVLIELQTLTGVPVTASQKTTFEIRRDGDWQNAPAGLRAAPVLESLLDLPLLLSTHFVCADGSFRARCRPDPESTPLRDLPEGSEGKMRAIIGISWFDELDSEFIMIAVTDWLLHMAAHRAELLIFDATASTDVAAFESWTRTLGCTPDQACRVVSQPKPRQREGASGQSETESVASLFEDEEFVLVYLSSWQQQNYSDFMDEWLPKVRIGGYMAGMVCQRSLTVHTLTIDLNPASELFIAVYILKSPLSNPSMLSVRALELWLCKRVMMVACACPAYCNRLRLLHIIKEFVVRLARYSRKGAAWKATSDSRVGYRFSVHNIVRPFVFCST